MSARRRSILVVDDTPDSIMVLCALLKEAFDTKVAVSGEAALRVLRAAPVDLVLLDVMMPGLDGYEVCRRIRAAPATAALPVVFLTARDTAEDAARALAAGGSGHLAKPVDPDRLHAMLARCFGVPP
ncbi:response regulator [Pseudoduganella chitinolytica]|uniref:Response regulator n=1 Tax=Pseudoduganella chitinolytica TaxID=34070 RepID=A0ABY8BHC0_9BURK|nr:response regulator [Pseudoduganella chitinolytica]WEF35285.1 response regulator [Pseudoduganella chitinolytica]